MRNTTKRIIALVLVAFMVAACMAVGVSAAEPKVTVNVLTGSVEVSADALAKLADGNRAADATAFSMQTSSVSKTPASRTPTA